MAAVRTEVEANLDEAAALGASAADRLPKNKIENDPQSIRDQDRHEGPEHRAHAPAASVAGDVANKQQVTSGNDPCQQSQQGAHDGGRGVVLSRQHHVAYHLHDDEADDRQDPRPQRDDADFAAQSDLGLVLQFHSLFPLLDSPE